MADQDVKLCPVCWYVHKELNLLLSLFSEVTILNSYWTLIRASSKIKLISLEKQHPVRQMFSYTSVNIAAKLIYKKMKLEESIHKVTHPLEELPMRKNSSGLMFLYSRAYFFV